MMNQHAQLQKENVMRKIRVEKINLNLGVGGSGDKLDKALKLLEKITGRKPVAVATKKRIPTWGLRPGLQIGARVTMRGKKAESLLGNLLKAVDSKMKESSFDDAGNVSFGIAEYINIPGVKYDSEIGIIGFEVAVTLQRPGFRVKRRRMMQRKVGRKHRITHAEAIAFMKERFGVHVE